MAIRSKPTHNAQILVDIRFKYTNSDPHKHRADLEIIGNNIVDYVEKNTGNYVYFDIDDDYEFEAHGVSYSTYIEALEELAGLDMPSCKVYWIQYYNHDDRNKTAVRCYRDTFEKVCKLFVEYPNTFLCNDLSLEEEEFIEALRTGLAVAKISG